MPLFFMSDAVRLRALFPVPECGIVDPAFSRRLDTRMPLYTGCQYSMTVTVLPSDKRYRYPLCSTASSSARDRRSRHSYKSRINKENCGSSRNVFFFAFEITINVVSHRVFVLF